MIDKNKLFEMIDKTTFIHDIQSDFNQLDEVSFARVMSEYFDRGFIIISAFRTCDANKKQAHPSSNEKCSNEENIEQKKINVQNDAELKSLLKKSRFGYIPVYGGFKEKGVDTPSPELAYVVVAKEVDKGFTRTTKNGTVRFTRNENGMSSQKIKINNELKRFGIELAKRFNQDSFLYKPANEIDPNAYYVNKAGEVEHTFSEPVKIEDITQQYFTQLRKGMKRRFTFVEDLSAEEQVFWIPKPPSGMTEAVQRYNEIFYRFDKKVELKHNKKE